MSGYMEKDLTKEFQLISNFENGRELIKENNNYEFTKLTEETLSHADLRFYNINNEVIIINNENIKIISSRVPSHQMAKSIKFSISEWKTESFKDDNSLFKLLIPNSKDIQFNYYFNNLIGMKAGKKTYFINGISFGFKEKNFIIYQLNDFFILESLNSIDYNQFKQLSRIILAAFGFITGYVPLNYGYFFSYENESDAFTGVRFNSSFSDTYKTHFALFSLNAYEYITDEPFTFEDGKLIKNNEIEEIEKKLTPITKEMFSNFCCKMTDDSNFANAIFSILEVNSSGNKLSLYSRGGLYSVVLERITNIISQENKDNISPIKDKVKAKEFMSKLVEVADDFFKSNNLGDFPSAIKAKLENINNITNQDKLFLPYEILDIPLNDKDKEIIKHRNKFLHGKNMEELGVDELFRINLELNFLINALVFKKIGWTGIVQNLSKTYLEHKQLEVLNNAKSYKEI